MTRLSRLGFVSVLLFGVSAACGARTGLPIPVCKGQPLKRVSGPNVYFILDRSNSMSRPANPADPTSPTKWQVVLSDVADLMIAVGSEAQFGAAEFPGSGDMSCSPGAEVMALTQGDGLPATEPGSTASVFLNATTGGTLGGTPTADTFVALTPELTGFKGHTFVILATDGGPNCNTTPGETCGADTCTANIDGLECLVGGGTCTANGANCCLPDSCVGATNCLDDTRTVAAIDALAHPLQGEGVPTFVIGIPGSEAYSQVLTRMASAGGTALATKPYYQVDTADSKSLVGAFAEIAAQIAATCVIQLEEAPADPAQVNVLLEGRVVPQSGANGWTLSGSLVTVLGASCDKVHTGVHSPVVTDGCPTVTSVTDGGSPVFSGSP